MANAGDGDEEMLAMLSGVGEEAAGDIGLFEEEPEETVPDFRLLFPLLPLLRIESP